MLKKSVRKISSSIYYLLCKQQVTNYSRIGGRAFVCYSAPHTVKWQLAYSLFWPNAKLSRKKCYIFSLQANIETWQNRNFSLIYVALVTWTELSQEGTELIDLLAKDTVLVQLNLIWVYLSWEKGMELTFNDLLKYTRYQKYNSTYTISSPSQQRYNGGLSCTQV